MLVLVLMLLLLVLLPLVVLLPMPLLRVDVEVQMEIERQRRRRRRGESCVTCTALRPWKSSPVKTHAKEWEGVSRPHWEARETTHGLVSRRDGDS